MSNSSSNVETAGKRRFARRHVLLKAKLDTGHYEFDCMAYDLSLKGAKLKIDLPLQTKCAVQILVKQGPLIPAEVVWSREGFVGVEFTVPVAQIQKILDDLGLKLPNVGDVQ